MAGSKCESATWSLTFQLKGGVYRVWLVGVRETNRVQHHHRSPARAPGKGPGEHCARTRGDTSVASMGRPLPPELIDPDDREVLLGLPGAWADDTCEAADHYTTKIGGQPDWPVALEEINRELLKCGVCGGYLGLVAQVYAPLTLYGIKMDERSLYVLGCPSANCGIDPASWRTIRFQKEVSEEEALQAGEDQIESAGSSSIASSSGLLNGLSEVLHEHGWGEASTSRSQTQQLERGSDWWDENSWDDFGAGTDEIEAMSLQELQSSLLEAGYLAAAASSQPPLANQEAAPGSGAATSIRVSDSDLPTLPCFYVYTQSESSTPQGSASDSVTLTELEGADIVDEIEDPYGIVEGVGELWEGEEYEPEQALSADRMYLKFKKKLDASPEQCFRYCFGGQPLWASEVHEEPGVCSACGGPRVYEMQLMPPLLFFLQQAFKDLPPSSYGPNDWEWSTLVVYSCAQSCSQRASERVTSLGEQTDWSVIEEATIIQAEVFS